MNKPNLNHTLIVGAGFAGSVSARQIAGAGNKVTLIDKRSHIGGNAYDKHDENGVLIHPYGPHIFHTNSKKVFEYLSKFTDWRFYEHRVLASVESKLLPIPINRTTLNQLYDLNLTESETQDYLDKVRIPKSELKTSEDVVLNSVGEDLCEKFFRGYTQKQWGLDLSELSAGVAARIPTRTNDDDRYFSDVYQFMPNEGYTRMFERMLSHPNIRVLTNTEFKNLDAPDQYTHIIYTGPIDEYFNRCHGALPYRSLRFEHDHLQQDNFQKVGTVNYPNEHQYTRITEFKHLTGQTISGTSIVREYPSSEGDPFYPIPRKENEEIFKLYQSLSEQKMGVTFIGRLAQYRYYNMDQIVAAALKVSEELINHSKQTS